MGRTLHAKLAHLLLHNHITVAGIVVRASLSLSVFTEWSDKPQGSGSMVLLDEDVRGRLDGEWKRVNTLAHYQVGNSFMVKFLGTKYEGNFDQSPSLFEVTSIAVEMFSCEFTG